MDLISPEEVIRQIESYFTGGLNRHLTRREQALAKRAIAQSLEGPRFETTIHLGNVVDALERAARDSARTRIPDLGGRGIVLFAANRAEMLEVLACVRVLHTLGSDLPIECHFLTSSARRLSLALGRLGATVLDVPVDDDELALLTRPELRLRALAQSRFARALVLEPGTFPLLPPQQIFAENAFRKSSLVMLRGPKFNARCGVWKLCGLPMPRHSAEAAVLLIDRERSAGALSLWRWIVDRAYFFTGYTHADGDAAQLALAKLSQPARLSVRLARHFWRSLSSSPSPDFIRRELRAVRRLFP